MKLYMLCVSLSVAMLIATSSALAQDQISNPAAGAQGHDVVPDIPAELSYAAEFVQFLRDAGLVVEKVRHSHFEAMFRGVRTAAFISTNKGIVEVVIFPGSDDAEKIKVTLEKGESEVVPYRYVIEGQPNNGRAEIINAAYPFYFSAYRNWFVITTKGELDASIKSAIKRRQNDTSVKAAPNTALNPTTR